MSELPREAVFNWPIFVERRHPLSKVVVHEDVAQRLTSEEALRDPICRIVSSNWP